MQADIFREIDALQKEIQRLRPLNADFLKQIREHYKIGLTYSSNALIPQMRMVRESQKDYLRLFAS